ncbi:MAG: AraC family transcriptional regulator [Kiritimatiellia bacterium]
MNAEALFSSMPDIRLVQVEIYSNPGRYSYDNSLRTEEKGFVIQQTLQGSAYFVEDGVRKRVGAGQAMLFGYAENTQYGLDRDCDLPYGLCWILLTGGAGLHSLVREIRWRFGSVLQMSEKGEAAELLRRCHEDFVSGNFRDRWFMAENVYRLLFALYREQVAGIQGNDPVSYGRYLLETQFRSPRNLKEWVGEIGITREHFTREFHARYGESPAGFLRRLRLEHARGLLRNHTLSLQDVAQASGFASAQTFHRAYKNHFGCAAGGHR